MLREERHRVILEAVERDGHVRVADLVALCGVSEITIRRDLGDLAALGRLSRVHGGAARPEESAAARTGGLTIGVVMPSTTYYMHEVIKGIEHACRARNVRPILGVTNYDPTLERQRLTRLQELGVKGVILATAAGQQEHAQVADSLAAVTAPVVLVERAFRTPELGRDYSHVRTDHAHGARLAVRHLRSLGHERIGLAAIDSPTRYWLELGVADEAGGDSSPPMVVMPARYADPSAQDAAIHRLIAEVRAKELTGLIIHSDIQAIRFIELAHEQGLRVPQDVSVVAYDDVYAALQEVGLTAVGPPRRRVGIEAVKTLFAEIGADRDEPVPVQHLSLLPILTVRSSTASRAPSGT